MNAIKKPARFVNTLYTADNLYVLKGLNSEIADLIYLDPPFNTKRLYAAPIGSRAAGASFKDMWRWEDVDEQCLDTLEMDYPDVPNFIRGAGWVHSPAMMAYLTYMAQRLVEMYRILKSTGSLYFHCDPTASHYLKGLLDGIFGRRNFVNEIVWCYDTAGRSSTAFPKKHDIILFYSKARKPTFYAREVTIPMKAGATSFGGRLETDSKGRQYRLVYGTKNTKGETRYYNYLDKGKVANDWWTDIPALQSNDRERTGYPTQKPLALLHRIIKASSNEGDIVLDPFCGCATTCVAAQQLGRKWLGIDIENKSVDLLVQRLSDDAGLFKNFIATTDLPQRTDVEYIAPSLSVKEHLYKEQDGLCKACGIHFDIRNLEIDHKTPKSKGGGDYYENYQLLCSNCNRTKGDRPMEYLLTIIAARDKLRKQIFFAR